MKRLHLVPLGAIAAIVLTTAAARWPAPEHADLIVHEWGTFTSVAGSDGVLLPGIEREEEALPAAVEADLVSDWSDEGATAESIAAGEPPAWTHWASDRFGAAYEARVSALTQ